MLRVYFGLIIKVWIQIRRAIWSWFGLRITSENLIPLIYGVSVRFNSRWSLALNSNHWERSDLLETPLSLVFRGWSKFPQHNKQSNPLLGLTIKPTSTINYQISPYAKVGSTPNPKRLLTAHTINIYLVMTTNPNMMIKLLKLSKNIT